MTKFAQHNILLTGATGGIGRALSHALNATGAHVIATARSETALKDLAASLPNPITILPADLASKQGVDDLLRALEPRPTEG